MTSSAGAVARAVPRVIHQTWRSRQTPMPMRAMQAGWRLHHPTWRFRLWTDDDLDALVRRHAPHLLALFRSYAEPVCRADLGRFLILLVHGGVYVDLDFECFRPVDDLLQDGAFSLGEEPAEHLSSPRIAPLGLPRLLSPAWMAAPPGHAFTKAMLNAFPAASDEPDVLARTGPVLLTRVHARWDGSAPVRVLPASALHPFTLADTQSGRTDDFMHWDDMRQRTRGAHLWAGTWWRPASTDQSLPLREVPIHMDGPDAPPRRQDLAREPAAAPDAPLISCLMVTRNRFRLARQAAECWRAQSWPHRELVIVDDGGDDRLQNWAARLNDPRIRHVRLPDRNQTLGELRNVAIDSARGDWIAQWDDDDLYHPLRLEAQWLAARASGAQACFLRRWLMHWPSDGRLAVSGARTWEGSLLARRDRMARYPSQRRGEDTVAVERLLTQVQAIHLDLPGLYLYRVHGRNTWDAGHFEILWRDATRRYEGRDADTVALKAARMFPGFEETDWPTVGRPWLPRAWSRRIRAVLRRSADR